MKRILFTAFIMLYFPYNSDALSLKTKFPISTNSTEIPKDSLIDLQNLYSGKIWTNNYRNINENQFLFESFFLPGTVSIKGITYKNLLLKYDIYLDELLIPADNDEIIQLNKELIDSFSIKYKNKIYKFIKISPDTLSGLKEFNGFMNVALNGESILYVKYLKKIVPGIRNNLDYDFIQSQKIYLYKSKNIFPITSKAEFYKVLGADMPQINTFVKSNKLNVSVKDPESLIQIVRFYNSLKGK